MDTNLARALWVKLTVTEPLAHRTDTVGAAENSSARGGAPHLDMNGPLQPTCLRLTTRADDSSEDGQRCLFIGRENCVKGSEFLLIQVLPVRQILVEGVAALFRC